MLSRIRFRHEGCRVVSLCLNALGNIPCAGCFPQPAADKAGDAWQALEHKGRLTVVLDMDGTLLSSFTPRRAPVLPPGSIAYVVGRGGRLNPNGVFVVERPGLLAFFQRLAEFAGAAQPLHVCLQSRDLAEEALMAVVWHHPHSRLP